MAKIKYENIMQSWDAHIPGMGSKVGDFYNSLTDEWERKQTGLDTDWENIGGLFGAKKKMMKIQFNRYCCYIAAESFGSDLICTWQLYDPKYSGFGNDGSLVGLFKSDFNEVNDLRAFAAVCLDSAKKAAERVLEDNNMDVETVRSKRSSGALGSI